MRSPMLFGTIISLALSFAPTISEAANNSLGGRQFFSPFAPDLGDICKDGWSDSKDAMESRQYCVGFTYAVLAKLESEGKICFGADITEPIREYLELLPAAPKRLKPGRCLGTV